MKVDLDRIGGAKPCNQSWNEMTGDDRVRNCAACKLSVFNISEMTRDEATELIHSRTNQRLCIRLYRRGDGTVITRDCPGAAQKSSAVRTLRKAATTAALALAAAGCAPTPKADAGSPAVVPETQQCTPAGTGPDLVPEFPVAGQALPIYVEMGDFCEIVPPVNAPTPPAE
jgi:hypothetical protein